MKRMCHMGLRVSLMAGILLLGASFASASPIGFLYVNNSASPNSVSGFSVDSSGTLTALAGSPFATGGNGSGGYFAATRARALLLPGTKRLYVSNDSSATITGFDVGTTGTLTAVPGSPFSTALSDPESLAATPDGSCLFVAASSAGGIARYTVAPNGSLALAGSLATTGAQDGIAVSPDGEYLVVAKESNAQIAVYAVGGGCSLTAVAGSPFAAPMNSTHITFNSAGTRIFGAIWGSNTQVGVYDFVGGVPIPIAGSPFTFASGVNSNVSILRGSGDKLFVSNQSSNTVTVLDVAPSGTLSLVAGSPFAVGGNGPSGVDITPDGTLLFTINYSTRNVSVMSVAPSGSLTAVPGSPFSTGASGLPEWLVFVPSCGNGVVDSGEQCDDNNSLAGDCCSPTCQYEPNSNPCTGDGNVCTDDVCNATGTCQHLNNGNGCDDGVYCNGADTCSGGGCNSHAGDPCTGTECNVVCNEATDDCFDPDGTPCSTDNNPCTEDECDGAGACGHDPGNAGAVCRVDTGDCDVEEQCDGVNAACPPDGFEALDWPCGNPLNDGCTDPDSCDGSGNCLANHAAAGSGCPDDGLICTEDECDGGGACIHPAGNAGVECRPDGGQCDVAEQCNGTSSTCPPNGFEPSGTPCNDNNVCTQTDQCNGSNVCVGSNPMDCSDGDICTADLCDPQDGCDNPGALAASCKTAQKSILILKQNGGAGDKQLFKWVKGESLDQITELGDPTATTDYSVCIYKGTSNDVLESFSVPAAGGNWSPIGPKGYKYKELNGDNDGVTKIILKGGDAGKTKVLVKGKGGNLPDPVLTDLSLPVTAQVINPDTGVCVEAVFDTGNVKKNTDTLFKAKTP